jgi:putative phosphoserine phosphatase/1-acylglycerol-3-phosphate O-acyltransferase
VSAFKKGPFRIAITAKIPIVPVVIRNAELIAERHSSFLRLALSMSQYSPPISVTEWTLGNLDEQIAGVRKLYIDALTSWPDAVGPPATPGLGPT